MFKVLLRKGPLALFVVLLSSLPSDLAFLTKNRSLTCTHHLLVGPRPWVLVVDLILLIKNQRTSRPRKSTPATFFIGSCLTSLSLSHHPFQFISQLPEHVSLCLVVPDQKKCSSFPELSFGRGTFPVEFNSPEYPPQRTISRPRKHPQ